VLPGQSDGSTSLPSPAPGPVTLASVPSGPLLPNQQLRTTEPTPPSSHQKSSPFGATPLVAPTLLPNL
jgi:hypothetical protein